jgi:hypothetical protein
MGLTERENVTERKREWEGRVNGNGKERMGRETGNGKTRNGRIERIEGEKDITGKKRKRMGRKK